MYCPSDCPLTIEFLAFGKTYLVNPSVKLTCSEHIFEKDIEVIAQPGIHSMEVKMDFFNSGYYCLTRQGYFEVLVIVVLPRVL